MAMDKLVRQQALSPAEKDEKTRPMEKEKRNYVEELENLKTAFLGYDKEAVLTYIQSLFDALEEEQQAFQNAEAETQRALAAENAALQSELQTRKLVYEELVKRVDQLNLSMDASMDKMGNYAKESAHALETYRRREQEILTKEREAEAQRKLLLQKASAEAAQIKHEAEAQLQRAAEEAARIQDEAARAAEHCRTKAREEGQQMLLRTQTRIEEILQEAKERANKEKASYVYYRQCLRNYCEHLEAYLDETEQQTVSKHTKTQEISQQTVQPEADAEQISKQTETEQG